MSTPSPVQTAELLTAKREYRKAVETYRLLLEADEYRSVGSLWYDFGRVLMLDQQYYDAIDAFTTATTLDPQNPAGMAALGDALSMVHEYEEAKVWFEKAAGLEDNIRYQFRVGDMLAYLGKYDEALVFYTLLSAKNPENPDLLRRKARVLHHLGREADSMTAITEEIRLRQEILAQAPDAEEYARLAAAYRRSSLWQEAAAMYEEAVRCNPMHPEYHMYLGTARIVNKDVAAGVAEFETAADLAKDNFAILVKIAEAATRSKCYGEAIRYYTEALALRNISGDAWAGIAYALLMLDNQDDARAFFEMAKATTAMREIPWADRLHKSYKTEALDQAFS